MQSNGRHECWARHGPNHAELPRRHCSGLHQLDRLLNLTPSPKRTHKYLPARALAPALQLWWQEEPALAVRSPGICRCAGRPRARMFPRARRRHVPPMCSARLAPLRGRRPRDSWPCAQAVRHAHHFGSLRPPAAYAITGMQIVIVPKLSQGTSADCWTEVCLQRSSPHLGAGTVQTPRWGAVIPVQAFAGKQVCGAWELYSVARLGCWRCSGASKGAFIAARQGTAA